jgi:hypothetical protein
MCEALSSKSPPSDPTEILRWVHGIAKHKVADFHRSRKFRSSEPLPELSQAPAPFEARSAPRWVLHQVCGQENKATLLWAIREDAREGLDEIAKEAAFAPAAVRQRVSRFRRNMRTRYLALAAAAALLALGGSLLQYHAKRQSNLPAIIADSSSQLNLQSFDALQGNWRVVSLHPSQALDPKRVALTTIPLHLISIRVQDSIVRVSSPLHQGERRLTRYDQSNGELVMLDDGGREQVSRFRWEGSRLVVNAVSGVWQGEIVLERR